MPLSAEQKKQLEELKKQEREEEEALQAAEAEKLEAEKAKRDALSRGDKKEAKKQEENVIASESSIHNLTERLASIEEACVMIAEMKGGAEGKTAMENHFKKKRFLRSA
jgi:hypothetical protein